MGDRMFEGKYCRYRKAFSKKISVSKIVAMADDEVFGRPSHLFVLENGEKVYSNFCELLPSDIDSDSSLIESATSLID